MIRNKQEVMTKETLKGKTKMEHTYKVDNDFKKEKY